jgi:hypothetical protein
VLKVYGITEPDASNKKTLIMKHTIFIPLIVCLNIGIINGQDRISNVKQFKYVDSPELDYYFQISEKPVTNLDYLIYLCWINDVFSAYPDIIINSFPSLKFDSLTPEQQLAIDDYYMRFSTILEISDSELVNRLFDFRYINYPVIGLSKSQINRFNKWLTDRYNENYAIDKKIFFWDPNQIGSEQFSTESYLFGQYDGLINKNIKDKTTKKYRRINWLDNFFISTFRLPTDKELSIIDNETVMKEYDSFTFLKKWSDFYIVVNKNGLTLKREDMSKPFLDNYQPDFELNPKDFVTVNESFIPVDSGVKLQSVYRQLGQKITEIDNIGFNTLKDSLGYFPFQIISSRGNEPIYANPPTDNTNYNLTIFRLVINEYK